MTMPEYRCPPGAVLAAVESGLRDLGPLLLYGRADAVSGSCQVGNDLKTAPSVCPAFNHELRDGQMTHWLLRSYLELGALPGATPCARLHAKQRLWEWGMKELSEDVELVISELVTNAQQVSAGLSGSRFGGRRKLGVPPIRLWLYADKQRVLIKVWDGDDRLPEEQDIDLMAESGRGLLIVATLCAEWGVYRPEGATGKVVWGVIEY
jgi:hypothetical protein